MPDLTAIGAALSSLKAAKDIAEAMVGLRDSAAFQGKLIEFQSKIIDANNAAFAAQEERASLLETISDLEDQVAKFEAWDREKKRYKLCQCASGTFAYVLKRSKAAGEPGHALCAACYERGHKYILQSNGIPYNDQHAFVCPSCKSEVKTTRAHMPEYAD